ncbi:GNAT family N-acetyltransferase [Patiriisocius hiemis]|uniref:GNAT family N-acetyltransferase n=1 Tax=Patiriisocius hiemis TaxID=3075604 RepID=A0ABU2YE53_9FLAO|nr:GNAT family N-acetyltransferase [Constantimarinum sp. W242]MDT0556458.1 GNAT family N-acetyltransferase [Constantimarinum sp. W242]
MICYKQANTIKELKQILALQKRNLLSGISEEEAKKEGFVSVHHTLELLQQMNESCPHTIAKDGDTVIGYALSMHPKFGNSIEMLKPMFTEIDTVTKKNSTLKNYIVMGQICIDVAYRKQGIFRELYTAMKAFLLPTFSTIITEVDIKNNRSLQAHYAIGFKKLSTYSSGGQDWELIYLI